MAELLALTDSRELTAWQELLRVHADERQHAEDVRQSGDGVVHDPRARADDDGDDEDEDGGEAE